MQSPKLRSISVLGELEAQKAKVPSVPQPLSVRAVMAASVSPVAEHLALNSAVPSTIAALRHRPSTDASSTNNKKMKKNGHDC